MGKGGVQVACTYAVSQGWLIVQDDTVTLTTAGLVSIRNWFADRQAHGSDRPQSRSKSTITGAQQCSSCPD